MKKLLITIIIVVVVFAGASFFVSVFLVRNRLDSQTYGEKFTEINTPFSFWLIPTKNNINILIIHLKNPILKNSHRFDFRIYEDDNVLRETIFTGKNVGDPSDLKFQFEPIDNSANRQFRVEISSENYQEPISIYTNLQNEPFYRLYYRSSDLNLSIQYWIGGWVIRIRNNLGFFVIWTIALIGLLFWGTINE